MHYLVTGGCGFIGSNYARGLLTGRWGQEVRKVSVVDKLTYAGNLDNLREVDGDPRLHFYKNDILDTPRMKELLQDVDVVVHFAAESHVDRSIQGSSEFIQTNVAGTHSMLQASMENNVKIFLHVSTDEVYGSIDTGSWTEEEPLLPNSPYAASKAASDLIARSYFVTHGLDVRITRCSNNFGPYQYPEKVIPLFITNLLEGKKIPLYGDGLNVRDWLHVDDHCLGIQAVIEKGQAGEIYNIGGGTELNNNELTSLILQHMNQPHDMIQLVEDRIAHDRRYSVNISKSERLLGYSPTKSLDSALPTVIEWYQNNEAWWKPLKNK